MKEFTADHMMRVYPKGTRVLSGNYNPTEAWDCGLQIVSLNFQTKDKYLGINYSMFSKNQNSGYLEQPYMYKANLAQRNLTKRRSIGGYEHLEIGLEVVIECLTGQELLIGMRQSYKDFYIQSKIYGSKEDSKINPKTRIHSLQKNFYHMRFSETQRNLENHSISASFPNFAEAVNYEKKTSLAGNLMGFGQNKNEALFKFLFTRPESAIINLRIKIGKSCDDLPQANLLVGDLREGLRVVQFFDKNFNMIPDAFLLVQVKLREVRV